MGTTTSTDPVTGTEYATEEFEALRDMLDAEGIDWHDNSDSLFHRTQGEHAGRRFSAIFGFGSYGWQSGLLEVRMDSDEPIGWITASDAMSLIAGDITEEQADYIAQANHDRAKREAI